MNSKFRILTSFLIALCFHLILFNLCTFVFPIDPAVPKPKFFFLGSILKQNDVKQIPSENHESQARTVSRNFGSTENNLRDMPYETADQTGNPFAIGTIKKPLIPQTAGSQEKIVIKSVFETPPEKDGGEETEQRPIDQELDIRPYRPLRFRSPQMSP